MSADVALLSSHKALLSSQMVALKQRFADSETDGTDPRKAAEIFGTCFGFGFKNIIYCVYFLILIFFLFS